MSERKARARDEGAPDAVENSEGVVTSALPGGQSVPASRTVSAADPAVEDVQAGAVLAGSVSAGLPVGLEQIERPDALNRLAVPTAAPSGAPAGSTWGDATVDRQPSQLNENDPGPSVAYVVTWAKAAVHVDAAKVSTRAVGEGDDARDEKYVSVASATGNRVAVLEGEQVTLERGEALPDEAAPGQGAFLVSIGAAIAVSVPPA